MNSLIRLLLDEKATLLSAKQYMWDRLKLTPEYDGQYERFSQEWETQFGEMDRRRLQDINEQLAAYAGERAPAIYHSRSYETPEGPKVGIIKRI